MFRSAVIVIFAIQLLAGCQEFATPAELEKPQILAILAEPASVRLDESTNLSILAAGPDGPLEDLQVRWQVISEAGRPALGEVEGMGSTAVFRAPGDVETFPTGTMIEARVDLGDEELVGLKAMLIGGPRLENPVIEALLADGQAVDDELVVGTGQQVELSLSVTSELSGDATFAWYARPGTIEEYLSSPTVLEAPDEPANGWLYGVVRDQGGIAWRSVRLRVE